MKVRITRAIAGTRPDTGKPFNYKAGDEADLPADFAQALCKGVSAEQLSSGSGGGVKRSQKRETRGKAKAKRTSTKKKG